MAEPQQESESFIVRVWREPRELDGATSEWRGTIEHVGGSERAYFTKLHRMAAFVRPYLTSMGVKWNWKERLRNWLET